MADARYSRGRFEKLENFLGQALDRLGVRHRLMEYQAVEKWPSIVGPKIASAALAETVRDGILFVSCKSSIWASELSLHKEEILKRVNSHLSAKAGKRVVKDIRFSSRGFARIAKGRRKEEHTHDSKIPSTEPLSEKDVKAAERISSVCSDEKLRERVREAIISAKRLWKARARDGWKECSACGLLHQERGELCGRCGGDR